MRLKRCFITLHLLFFGALSLVKELSGFFSYNEDDTTARMK